MKAFSREELLALCTQANLPKEPVEIPQFPGRGVWMRGLSGKERDDFEKSRYSLKRGQVRMQLDNIRARLVVRSLVDEYGTRLLKDDDADLLGNLRSDVLSMLYEKAQRLSNVTDEDIDELKKLSETAAGGDSPSP